MMLLRDHNSSLGPDGFSGSFYKACWHITGIEVCQAVQSFFVSRKRPNGFNANSNALVFKKKPTNKVDHFTTICMVNYIMKGILKILQKKVIAIDG